MVFWLAYFHLTLIHFKGLVNVVYILTVNILEMVLGKQFYFCQIESANCAFHWNIYILSLAYC